MERQGTSSGGGGARVLVVHGAGREHGLSARLVAEVVGELERRGAEYRLQDLLADGFDPVLRLGPDERHAPACSSADDPLAHRYQEEVRWAEALVLVHPGLLALPPVAQPVPQGCATHHEPGHEEQHQGGLLQATSHARGLGALPEARSAALGESRLAPQQRADGDGEGHAHHIAVPSGATSTTSTAVVAKMPIRTV
ncbi:MAG TPA: NAD(P)H-dependent oxidoreductase [Planctomycetota bacterium]|nr:NAD(P)H-dependent oxidoreductase [Planctomycetota bacterium]